MPDVKEVIASLRRMSTYYKSMMAVGSQEDMEIYTRHHEIVNMAIELLGEQQNQIVMMKMVYGDPGTVVGELVRCKDCKYRPAYPEIGAEIDGKWCYWCELHRAWKHDDWFCADGECK